MVLQLVQDDDTDWGPMKTASGVPTNLLRPWPSFKIMITVHVHTTVHAVYFVRSMALHIGSV